MGIVKIADDLHEEARIASKAMSRSINAQAEHWMKIGMLVEANPNMSYTDAIQFLLAEVRQLETSQAAGYEAKASRIMVKNADEIEKMRVAGRLTARVLEALDEVIAPGISTLEIDQFCENFIVNSLNAWPASKGQYNYPFSINTSINHVVCHGMPSDKKLKKGDIVNVDVTVEKDGFIGDSSKMFCIGETSRSAKRLVDITQQCLYKAIKIVKPGATLGDIGNVIQSHAEKNHYSIVREYTGHGIGREMHEKPQVLHFGKANSGLVLEAGMTFTIEPMINQGKRRVKTLSDGWTVVTADRRLSAQWEHTVLVTEKGCDVLTQRQGELI